MDVTKNPKRPRDGNQLAKAIVDLVTMDDEELKRTREKAQKSPGRGGAESSAESFKDSSAKS